MRADTLEADSALQQRTAELADLDARIDEQVRTAFLNLRSSSDLVAVAQSNIDLANQTLVQAQDRFAAGVANNLDVVQAQESVASANQSYIASLYAYNVAKSLWRRPSAWPSSRRCNISERNNHGRLSDRPFRE